MIVRARPAFTLFEVLLAIALALALSGAVLAFMDDLMTRRARTIEAIEDLAAGDSVIARLEQELMTTFVEDAQMGAGVRGTRTRLTVLSRGVIPPMVGDPQTIALGDLQGVVVEFDGREGVLRMGRFSRQDEPVRMDIVSERVSDLRLRYFDGRAWSESFNSAQRGILPVAVEVAIWFGDRPDEDEGEAVGGVDDDTLRGEEAMLRGAIGGEGDESLEQHIRRPDRLRVIAIPDGGGDDEGPGGAG